MGADIEEVYRGKITSIMDQGSIVQMFIIRNEDEVKEGERSFMVVNWDWRMFRNFAEGREKLVGLEVEVEGECVRVPGEEE